MKLRLLVASSLFVSVSTAFAAPPAAAAAPAAGPCEGVPAAEAGACWTREASLSAISMQEKLTIATDKLKAAKKDALVDQLKKSQYDWVVSRTSHCEFMEKAEAGTATAATARSSCLYRLTQTRTSVLAALISSL
jgi:uncharacterized protein YecT (DUF1311 family)